MKPTIGELARRAGVAKGTVSKALNGRKGVGEETRRRILDLAAGLNYEPAAAAQALAGGKSGSIGLFIPHEAAPALSGSYWSAVVTAVARRAAARGYSLLLLTSPREGDLSSPIESALRRRNVDGLILGADCVDPAALARLEAEAMPFVFIGTNPAYPHVSVDVDNLGGSRLLVSHLITRGSRRIACLAGPRDYPYVLDRVSGYREALAAAGLRWEAVAHSAYEPEQIRRAAAALASEHPDMDALYLSSGGDFLLDCIDLWTAERRPIPGGTALGAFDDYRFFDYLPVKVVSVRQPLDAIGAAAADALFAALSGDEEGGRSRLLDVELVVR